MELVFCGVQAVVGWVILMFVGAGLTNGLVRMRAVHASLTPFVRREFPRYNHAGAAIMVFLVLLGALYLYLLLHFGNIGVLAAAAMLMLARLPDLLAEIRTGQKLYLPATHVASILVNTVSWAALPVMWFALCWA